MSIGSIIFGRLTIDLDGALPPVDDRVFPHRSPEAMSGIYPRIVYQAADRETDRTYSGASGLVKQKAIISCLGKTYTEADQVAAAVRALFESMGGTWGGVTVQRAFVEDETEAEFTFDDRGEQCLIYSTELQITVNFNA